MFLITFYIVKVSKIPKVTIELLKGSTYLQLPCSNYISLDWSVRPRSEGTTANYVVNINILTNILTTSYLQSPPTCLLLSVK